MKKYLYLFLLLSAGFSCTSKQDKELSQQILNNPLMDKVEQMAKKIASTGLNAGDSYAEVWIRDFNTFIELSMEVRPAEEIKESFDIFFDFQGPEGDIIDGFVGKGKSGVSYDFRYCDARPDHAAHKNTVETDQEASLVQAVYKYVKGSGDIAYLDHEVSGKKVIDRLEWALEYLINCKWSPEYGLIKGATTSDWGDVQPTGGWGVCYDETTKEALDIYDNAMFVEAADNFMELCRLSGNKDRISRWKDIRKGVAANVRKTLWDSQKQKFIPHIYLNGSPFPADFDENTIYYHGGTAVAIEAGLLSKKEIAVSNAAMLANVKESGAPTIGLTVYPPYPEGFFENVGMGPYSYQNGGDWTWFGGRMIQALIANGFVREAYDEVQPMLQRVVDNNAFHEWYTRDGRAVGSGTFRGEAGVLYKSIRMLREWAEKI